MTNQIVLANPIANAVQPKPTKTEIVKALVQLRLQQIRKELDEHNAKEKALRKLIDTKARRFVLRHSSKAKCSVMIRSYYSPPKVEVEFTICSLSSPELSDLLKQYDTLNKSRPVFDEKTVKHEIMVGLEMVSPQGDRVEALLKSPASRKALESMLEVIK
jgi:hypothetical protein